MRVTKTDQSFEIAGVLGRRITEPDKALEKNFGVTNDIVNRKSISSGVYFALRPYVLKV